MVSSSDFSINSNEDSEPVSINLDDAPEVNHYSIGEDIIDSNDGFIHFDIRPNDDGILQLDYYLDYTALPRSNYSKKDVDEFFESFKQKIAPKVNKRFEDLLGKIATELNINVSDIY